MHRRGALLTSTEQAQIEALHFAGLSNRAIAAQLGRSHGCVNKYLRNPSEYNKKLNNCRPKVLTANDSRRIGRLASNSTLSIAQMRTQLGLNVSKMTIWRSVRRNTNITREIMRKAPGLTPQHKEARLLFARSNMTTQWDKVPLRVHSKFFAIQINQSASEFQVIFSDEKKFNLDGPDGYRHYWWDLRKEPIMFSRRNFDGGSLMTWAAFGSSGKLELAFISNRMDSSEYQEVLRTGLLPFLRGARRCSLVFQQDNAAVHVSHSTRSWLQEHRIQAMDWPACSSDCNPVENMWGIIVRQFYRNNKQYNTVESLKTAILEARDQIDDVTVAKLVGNMPNRIFEIIWWTDRLLIIEL
ncbi:transposase [Ancylostoma caninum]|uniref:Transposase n=1 Tax=Ancylostoma caninum TaxID=29170 RepID=A0A368FXH8_ANCCA|nr:transposase [Ancylostoma caninum]